MNHGASDTLSYVHSNHLFSVAAITDEAGTVIERYGYDAYGERVVNLNDTSFDQPYGFTGRRLDDDTGLWYFRARYFDSELGRFIGRDPLGYVDGYSMYSGYFVPNSSDPYGLFSIVFMVRQGGDRYTPRPSPPPFPGPSASRDDVNKWAAGIGGRLMTTAEIDKLSEEADFFLGGDAGSYQELANQEMRSFAQWLRKKGNKELAEKCLKGIVDTEGKEFQGTQEQYSDYIESSQVYFVEIGPGSVDAIRQLQQSTSAGMEQSGHSAIQSIVSFHGLAYYDADGNFTGVFADGITDNGGELILRDEVARRLSDPTIGCESVACGENGIQSLLQMYSVWDIDENTYPANRIGRVENGNESDLPTYNPPNRP